MRYARLKPQDCDTFMHVYNRIAGSTGEFPFGPVEKEAFIRRLTRLATLYVIDVVAFQCMGNHYHILCHIPAQPPTPEEAVARHARFHELERELDPQSERAKALALQLRDISAFMKDLQQPFTRWFNRTRPVRRRGHLWADRFKNTVLESGLAVWDCWKYIEMNPVRARMVASPADYRFSSFGRWAARGRHPFHEAVERCLLPSLQALLNVQSMEELRTELQKEFARITATEAEQTQEQINTAIAVAAEKERFSTRMDRRVRYWVDGLVIGSELFVRNTMVKTRTQCKIQTRRLTRARNAQQQPEPIYCFRQLRVLIE